MDEPGGSFKVDYPIKALTDAAKLRVPRHAIDEAATAENVGRLTDAIGDSITINVDITLKDVETVERDPERIGNWVAITREAIEKRCP